MISMQPPSICLSAFLGLRKKKMIVEAWRRPILIIDGPSLLMGLPSICLSAFCSL